MKQTNIRSKFMVAEVTGWMMGGNKAYESMGDVAFSVWMQMEVGLFKVDSVGFAAAAIESELEGLWAGS